MEKKKNKVLSNKVFVIFGILAILICLVAVFAPQICGDVDPTAGDLTQAIEAPSAEHPFGTDKMGRDIFARVVYGARSSLSSTLILVAVILVLGTFLGIISGYFGGWVDAVIMRIADMMIAFPGLVLAIAMSAKYTRQVRTAVLEELSSDYVVGARARGVKESKILWGNVFPNSLLPLITMLGLSIGSLLGGTSVVEVIFSYPGMGKLAVDAITTLDYNLVQGFVLWVAVIYMVVNLLVDLSYNYIDPRMRLKK